MMSIYFAFHQFQLNLAVGKMYSHVFVHVSECVRACVRVCISFFPLLHTWLVRTPQTSDEAYRTVCTFFCSACECSCFFFFCSLLSSRTRSARKKGMCVYNIILHAGNITTGATYAPLLLIGFVFTYSAFCGNANGDVRCCRTHHNRHLALVKFASQHTHSHTHARIHAYADTQRHTCTTHSLYGYIYVCEAHAHNLHAIIMETKFDRFILLLKIHLPLKNARQQLCKTK